MGRRKTKLALQLIPDEKSRKVTFRKRKNGLFKKAYELTTLCDVKVCTIVYEKKSEGKLGPPQSFPENSEEVKEIINKYRSNSSKIKKVQNLSDFYATQAVQVKKEITKLRNKSYEEKYPTWDDRLNDFSVDQMVDLLNNLENKIADAQKMHNMMMESKQLAMQVTEPAPVMLQGNEYTQMLGLFDNQNPSDGSSMMMMNGWDQPATTSNYNHTISPPTWDYQDMSNINPPSIQYGTMDENLYAAAAAGFYNPIPPSCMYDSIFSPYDQVAQQAPARMVEQSRVVVYHPPQQAQAPSGEQVRVGPLSVAYHHRSVSQTTAQPSFMKREESGGVAPSSEYDQQFQFVASQTQSNVNRMFYDSMFHYGQNNG